LQNWGDYADMSQGVFGYVFFVSNVFLICWFGTRLTQHVRKNGLLLCLFLYRYVENAADLPTNKAITASFNCNSFYLLFVLFSSKLENIFKETDNYKRVKCTNYEHDFAFYSQKNINFY
jgi:hypothetical protein